MNILSRVFLLAALFAAGGCASFSVKPLPADMPEQPWQAKAIQFDLQLVERTRKLSAIIVRATDNWVRSERSGTLPVGSTGRIAVVRNAWRAIAFLPDGSEVETSALLGPNNNLVVLLPGIDSDQAQFAKVLVLSGLSAFALDSSGREYGNDSGLEIKQLLDGVRSGSISIPVPKTVENLNLGTENGDFFLKGLSAMFPEEKLIAGKRYRVAATAPEGLERATHGYLSPDDRVISYAELFLAPGMGWIAVGESVARSVYQVGTAKPQGPYRLSETQNITPEREKAGDQ